MFSAIPGGGDAGDAELTQCQRDILTLLNQDDRTQNHAITMFQRVNDFENSAGPELQALLGSLTLDDLDRCAEDWCRKQQASDEKSVCLFVYVF